MFDTEHFYKYLDRLEFKHKGEVYSFNPDMVDTLFMDMIARVKQSGGHSGSIKQMLFCKHQAYSDYFQYRLILDTKETNHCAVKMNWIFQ